ncbi:VPLPA-CTERM sorting domain-containing protein [Pseudotabrizicola sediminis]|uniref:VPLPA-CTERM sorting domain-containing protein n=1 Tax=Pseudotabrizicola sediminis TaxID=2486418 RepID=A0ABY2KM77_9RHOB|nr:VPLPA-CTERM sorting domain-containing protein [Pseudotabrizicola sediminis]TGD42369.1 VPLPA-CTERM sorting domain-containing protein [Pseudotabrizicola sediminis]
MFRFTALAAAALLAGALSAQAATVTLFDDTFEADSAGVSNFITVNNLTNWNVTQGNVDILGAGFNCTGCIDLDGTGGGVPAKLETKQSFSFLDGITYTFSLFFSAGSAEETVTLGAIGSSFSFLAGKVPSVYTTSVVGSALTSPVFISLSGPVNNIGPYLDRVLITYDAPSPVPLPAAAPLLLAALGGLGLVARRRRRA